jgi:hypothetical protein
METLSCSRQTMVPSLGIAAIVWPVIPARSEEVGHIEEDESGTPIRILPTYGKRAFVFASPLQAGTVEMVALRSIALLWLGSAMLTDANTPQQIRPHSSSHRDQSDRSSLVKRRDAESASTVAMPRQPLGTHPPLPLGSPHVRSYSHAIGFRCTIIQY